MLNEQDRRMTGCFRTSPQGAMMNDAGLPPAVAFLNNCVGRCKLRQMMMPDAQGGGRMLDIQRNVSQGVEQIDELIPEDKPFERRSYKRTTLPTERRCLKAKVIIQDEEQALKEAKLERGGLVFWTDGSRKENERVGCAVVSEMEGRWKKRRVHLGRQKEAFDDDIYAMSEAMKIADEMAKKKEVTRVTVVMDSQATLGRIRSDEPGPVQVLVLQTMNWADALARKNIQVEYRWVPAHKGIEGNEEGDQQVVLATDPGNSAAVRVRTGYTVWFGSRTVQKRDSQLLGEPNPYTYLSNRRFCRVWLDPSIPISGSHFRIFLFMVAF